MRGRPVMPGCPAILSSWPISPFTKAIWGRGAHPMNPWCVGR